MKRKTSDIPTRIWTFGCLAPVEGADLFREQLFLANRYKNELVEIERDGREIFRQARARVPELQPVEQAYNEIVVKVNELCEQRKLLNKKARARVKAPEMDAQIKQLKAERKFLKARRDELRLELKSDPEFKRVTQGLNKAKYAEAKKARQETDLYWGSYLLVDKAMEQAKSSSTDPKFRHFDGTGRVGVQLQKGLTVPEALSGQDTRLRFGELPRDQWDTRSGRRRARTTVSLRIGSDGRKPIWATFPVVLHRELPRDGKIMWAWILVRKIGTDTKYELQIAMESDSFRHACKGEGSVAVDIGWRITPEGVRVGLAVSNKGEIKSLILPEDILKSFDHANGLRSTNDKLFDQAKSRLLAWMKANPKQVPAWLKEDCKFLHAWRSHKKLAAIAFKLNEGRAVQREQVLVKGVIRSVPKEPDEDASIFEHLEWWRRKNRHLYQWEAHERKKAERRRKDLYRCWANELRSDFGKVIVEKTDFRQLARNAAPEEDPRGDYLHSIRFKAAPGELKNTLASTLGVSLEILPEKKRGGTCAVCEQDGAESGADGVQTCSCGAMVDGDFARCWVLLREAGVDTVKVQEKWQEAEKVLQQARMRAAE